jgi:hypothetical protein
MSQEQPGSSHASVAELPLNDHNEALFDISVLTSMAHVVADVTAELANQPEVSYPYILYRDRSSHLSHRVIIYAPPQPDGRDIPFVGFVSHHRPQVDPELVRQMDDVDATLVMELAAHGNLLSYSSLQLRERYWLNLVQFARPDGKETILATRTHQYAAYQLAPYFYHWIRLHHGTILQGDPANGLQLHLTKYYTFPAVALPPNIRVQHYQPVFAVEQ